MVEVLCWRTSGPKAATELVSELEARDFSTVVAAPNRLAGSFIVALAVAPAFASCDAQARWSRSCDDTV
jgi:hypothetical protein